MAGFHVFFSNRMELLAAQLAEVVAKPLSSPLKSEIVIVQNRSMERWLSMELALRHGVCANVRFPFSSRFLYGILAGATGARPPDDYEPENLTWRIMKILPECLDRSDFAPIRNYLAEDPDGQKRFQLSSRLALTYDEYLIFRPDRIMAWEKGENGKGDEAWQAGLWRTIREDCGAGHMVSFREAFLRTILEKDRSAPLFPERVSLFGISTLPRFHLDLFLELSRRMEVNGFFMNPCREFWGDIRSGREMGRMVQRVRERTAWGAASEEDLYLEEGNGLLASLGKQGRDFFSHLASLPAIVRETFIDPGEGSLLASIQSDILNLTERGRNGGPKKGISLSDRSVRLHSCHSPLREIEVLHDQLLEMFDSDPTLLPKDILVMAPNVETYAPLVEAVFDPNPEPSRQDAYRRMIPFSISDRGVGRGSAFVRRFLTLLDLAGGRFRAAEVLAPLETVSVRQRFGLAEGDLEGIRRAVANAGIRWGIDAGDRLRAGLPAFPENTWRAGLDRLLLGYALPGRGERLFAGVLPYDEIEGHDAVILGRFITYAETLFAEVRKLNSPRTLGAWAEQLSGLLDRISEPSGTQDEEGERSVRRCLENLRQAGEKAAFCGTVELAVVKSWLENSLEKTGLHYGYMTGGVTFCALVPMRSIPFKVICLLGMNNADYPRISPPAEFDLIAQAPRPGDRSRRDDDRYLFLEAILSARETLLISHVGQSIADNSIIPPSVLVSELLDHLEEGFFAEGKSVREHVTTRHHLQPFHPDYFTGDVKLFSYSGENCRAAGRLLSPLPEKPRFLSGSLPDPEPARRNVSTSDLTGFFLNPARWLLERRLGLRLEKGPEIPEEREMFRIEGLDGYRIGELLLPRVLAGEDPAELFGVLKAAGGIPHGTAGLCQYEELACDVRDFAGSVAPLLRGGCMPPPAVDLVLGDYRLSGRLSSLYEEGFVHFRYARVRARDHLRLWIDHLLFGAGPSGPTGGRSILLGRNEAWAYGMPPDPRAILTGLLELYGKGLRVPLPFFPETSLAYAEALCEKNKTEREALAAACRAWEGNEILPGEGEEPYIRLCFGNAPPPFDSDFKKIAAAVFGPLLANRERIGR